MSDWGTRELAGEHDRGRDDPLAGRAPDDQGEWRAKEDDCQVPRDRLAQLVHIIESETIPRLVLAHQTADAAAREPDEGPTIEPGTVRQLATLTLSPDQNRALEFVHELRDRGVRRETIFLELLGPTARFLGQLWEQDLCDFTEVTIGLCRLHQLVRELSPGFVQRSADTGEARRALLAPVPGEQHTFGLLMVTEFFRREGWDVWGGPSAREQDVLQIVNAEWFSVVGFSVSCDDRLDALTQWIQAIRSASRNPQIGVLVGGRVFIDQPDLVTQVGADATALDGRQAPEQAVQLPRPLQRH